MAPLVDDEGLLTRLVNHIFLPPQLPQREDAADIDRELLRVTHQALQHFVDSLAGGHVPPSIPQALQMLKYAEGCHSFVDGTLSEAELVEVFGRLRPGQHLALRVRAQNAGLLVSKYAAHTTFEAFELAPINGAVVTTNGRLTRRFPGVATSIDDSTYFQPEFQATVAQALSTMSKQAAAEMQPMITKAGSKHEEERDTTHPGLVCELLVGGMLKALGNHRPHLVVDTIVKNTRDDVLWQDADLPWRRSPTWMLIRVALELVFSRSLGGANAIYKASMAFLMAELLDAAGNLGVSVDLQYAMSCKVYRRLQKLGQEVPTNVQKRLHSVLSSCNATISRAWKNVREAEPNSCKGISALASLQFAKDTVTLLPELDQYIEDRKNRRTLDSKVGFSAGSGLCHFTEYSFPNLSKANVKQYQIANLQEFENWAFLHLRKCSNIYDADKYCSELQKLVRDYHASARKQYERDISATSAADRLGNPEGMSVMLLTILELWVSMDEKALDECPLLQEFYPGIPAELLQNLLLSSKEQLTRLRSVETYLQSRRNRARHSTSSLFGNPRDSSSFAVQWFDRYGETSGLHKFLHGIQEQGERGRSRKLEELEILLEQYRELKKRALQAEHTFTEIVEASNAYPHVMVTRKIDDPKQCHKCIMESKAEKMRMTAHEWPLPSNKNECKSIVFELGVPPWYSAWRDCTLYVLQDVLKYRNTCEYGPKKQFPLAEDPHLGAKYSAPEHQRVVLMTKNKPHAFTHRQNVFMSKASEASICKDNATKYFYQDDTTSLFLDGFAETDEAVHACTYRFPDGSKPLDDYLFRPACHANGPAPNTVIAKQSACPKHMSVEEYKELCAIPSGHGLHWYNMLLQLASPNVDFRKDETVLTFFQCILQVGPFGDASAASATDTRSSYAILTDPGFARLLLDNLEEALARVKENWESMNALSIFSAITCRLLTLNRTRKIEERCLKFLTDVRNVAYGWLQVLRDRARRSTIHADHAQFLSKAIDVALVCGTTFDVDKDHLAKILATKSGSSILLQCSMAIAERERRTKGELLSPLLSWRFKRILHRALPLLCRTHSGIDEAVGEVWSAYRPGFGWIADPNSDLWLQTETMSSRHSAAMDVRYNLLSGELLVDGMRLARPPKAYEKDPIYRSLFGTTAVEVMPSKESAMRFSAKAIYEGFDVHLGMTSDEDGRSENLIVRATSQLGNYEALPRSLLSDRLPADFVHNYVHWLDTDTGNVLFEPAEKPWPCSSGAEWSLIPMPDHKGWRVKSKGRSLFGLFSGTHLLVSQMLSSLVESQHIQIILQPDHKAIDVEVPSLQLSFLLRANDSSLESKEYRGLVISREQSLGTLVGLENKLLLSPHKAAGSRLLLLPEGDVSYEKLGDHTKVTVDLASVTRVHAIQVDDRLGRLVDNGSIQSKLYLAYLHALTAFALPDPLTNKTGTEQALAILGSAAVRSFEQLTQENIDLLGRITLLTPARVFYPRDARVMQNVTWDEQLGFMAQHGSFHTSVQSILQQAERSRMFYPGQNLEFPDTTDIDEELLLRDLVRTAAFRVSCFGAEHQAKSVDIRYDSRDHFQTSSRAKNAYTVARMLQDRSDALPWQPVEEDGLWKRIKTMDILHEAQRPLEDAIFRYDAALLQSDSSSVLVNLLSLHKTLSHRNGQLADDYALMLWLATHAFSNTTDLTLLQTVVAFSTAGPLKKLQPPDTASLRPVAGFRPDQISVKNIVREAKRSFENTPDATSKPRKKKNGRRTDEYETEADVELRRALDYERHVEGAAKELSRELYKQWPCETLETPNCALRDGCTDFIDVSKALGDVSARFKMLRDNDRLHSYLQKLEKAMSGLWSAESSAPEFCAWPLKDAPCKQSRPAFVSVDDIFAGFRPQVETLPNHPEFSLAPSEQRRDSTINAETQLQALIDRLSNIQDGAYEGKYIQDLQTSLASLQSQGYGQAERGLPSSADELLPSIKKHLDACEFHLGRVYHVLNNAVRSELRKRSGEHEGLQWPRVSQTLFLEQLGRRRWAMLNQKWQEAIVRYGLAITAVQRAERLCNAAASGANKDDLIREIGNPGHTNWDPRQCPESLLLEVEGGIMIREVQEQIASEMRMPSSGINQVVQLNMGEGKSSVIVPMIATALADGSQLVRVVVAKPQSKQMAEMLISKLGGLLNRRICYMPFSRALKINKASAEALEALCQECMSDGSILLLQPEHILSFGLSGLESYLSGNGAAGEVFLRLQDFFDNCSRDIIDESDENFSVKFELIYTMGLREPPELGIHRWTLIQQVMDLVKSHALTLAEQRPTEVEITSREEGGFPRVRMLRAETAELLVHRIAGDICSNGMRGLPIVHQPQDLRDAIFEYISDVDVSAAQINIVQQAELWSDEVCRPSILLLRGLLAMGILEFALHSKRWRVNYGLTDRVPPTRMAAPYVAKDSPTPRSEFSHPDATIVLTSLSYYYGGLKDEDLFTAFSRLMTTDQSESEYRLWIRDVHIPAEFQDLSRVNLKDREQCITSIFPTLRYSKAAIDYFLSHIVFKKEMKQYPHKLSSSGCDLGKTKMKPTTGFSGTNDTRELLPMDVVQQDLPAQHHTNALVLEYLLQASNFVALMPPPETNISNDGERFLEFVMQLEKPVEVILDVGAYILELDNLGVAKAWLRKSSLRKEAAIYCNDNDQLCVVDRFGRSELLLTSSFASRLDVCVVYLDEAHTRGIDLKLPPLCRAAVTLGPKVTNDRLKQACMRLRKLGKGQNVTFCVPGDIQSQIRERGQLDKEQQINVQDVLFWVITETFAEVRRNISLWAVQNTNYSIQAMKWEKTARDGRHILTKDAAEDFLEPEARDLNYRYGPKPDKKSPLAILEARKEPRFREIAQKCKAFGLIEFQSRKLNEEQERELSPEVDVDAERVVQRALPATPAPHKLHDDVVQFVITGFASSKSKAYGPAFETLRNTSAGEVFDMSQLRDQYLLATTDFAQTVKHPGKGSLADSFQRSVQWILTSRDRLTNHVNYMLIVSPFEAQELLSLVSVSQIATLHLYRPRYNVTYRDMSKLDFCTIPSRFPAPVVPKELITQLNIFSGQLYFSSYDDFVGACKFLGLSHLPFSNDMKSRGWKVASDGFIERDDQGKVGGQESRVRSSPVNFLKVLLSVVRRNGEDISKTHLGGLLDHNLLGPVDFE
ncbi:uncharacterized protein MYCFIDRAFT_203611 [Pseudocercospora fijiensis CIRAD86]|uniref:ubiquitinyl hydrolase 1 n=1 Tax=Pseudocercospora fijiensis (strain CIRAD86) TaxID=383855 RepID=M3B1Y1_PSEFD|nr:uncharacterized protein MYCFIDRAFT_203611 [Pseudocercospora fijiensis CIRAD86]EME83378.1 hypothetical protein MYCFIDRAFT_203611 [Pseudocercospora fijiensis CIRAD86]